MRRYDNPPPVTLNKLKMDRQLMRRRTLQMFRFGRNTALIGAMLQVSEAEAYNLLHEAREEERRLNGAWVA